MKRKMLLIIFSVVLIIVPFFINVYSIYRLISVCLGIMLLDVCIAAKKKINIFLLIYLPILLLIFTYGIDYLKTYTLKLRPIYIFENKVNDDISIYNSLFYRVYKCKTKEYFDNNYEKNFMCETNLIEEIDINKLLNEPKLSYKEYKKDFIKVVGKISKISGTSSIEMQAYTNVEEQLNGYVKFNETSKLIINLNGIDISKYKIYDYITVVGLLDNYDKNNNALSLIDIKIEDNNLYSNYDIHIIESSTCNNELKEYINNYYLHCLENIYLDYKIDKYELSYALKDKKVNMADILKNSEIEEKDSVKIYKNKKFNILSCNDEKNIIFTKNSEIDYSLCEE